MLESIELIIRANFLGDGLVSTGIVRVIKQDSGWAVKYGGYLVQDGFDSQEKATRFAQEQAKKRQCTLELPEPSMVSGAQEKLARKGK